MTIAAELLDQCSTLDDVSPAAKAALAGVARDVRYREGERLAPLLNPPRQLLILLDGLAKLVGVSASGIERILYVFRPCEITGSRILLEDSSESTYEIIAMSPVRALAIQKRDFMAVGRDHPDVLVAITQEFSRRLNKLTSRMLGAMSAEVPVRLSKLLLDFSSDVQPSSHLVPLTYPLTHESMAQIIGASRPHTSTVLRDLEEVGAVQRKSPQGLLVRRDRLEGVLLDGSLDSLEPPSPAAS